MAGGRTCRRALRAASTAGRRERGASDAARGGAGGAPSASCLTPAGGSELGAVSGQGAAELRWWLARAGRHRAGHTLPAMLASYLLGSERHMEGLGHESGVGEWVLLGEGFRRNVHDSSECVGQERVAGMLPTLRCAPHGVLQRRRRWPRCPAPSASTCAPTRAWALRWTQHLPRLRHAAIRRAREQQAAAGGRAPGCGLHPARRAAHCRGQADHCRPA